MDLIRDLARKGAEEGRVVYVGSQSRGRGRHQREWVSPQGGLYCSILLRPQWDVQELPKVTLMTAVAVSEAIKKISRLHTKIKWPNDILAEGKKLAGILVKSEIKGNRVEYVVIGIGVNVNTSRKDLPKEAVSLRRLTSREYDLRKFLDVILKRMDYWYTKTSRHGFHAVLNRWRRLCGTLGQRILVKECGLIEGDIYDLADDGGLLIKQDDGWITKIVNGDVLSAEVEKRAKCAEDV